MKTTTFLLAASLALALVALAPSAAAIPGCTASDPSCEGLVCVGGRLGYTCVPNPFVVCVTEPCGPQWP